jgi:hypothetical protein
MGAPPPVRSPTSLLPFPLGPFASAALRGELNNAALAAEGRLAAVAVEGEGVVREADKQKAYPGDAYDPSQRTLPGSMPGVTEITLVRLCSVEHVCQKCGPINVVPRCQCYMILYNPKTDPDYFNK